MVKQKMLFVLIMAGFTQILSPGMALASEGSGAADYFIACVVTAGFSLGIAAGLAALSQAKAIYAACEGIARQPNASGKLTTTLVIGLAFIESLAIYVLIISLILFFVNPFQDML